jgi:hypothetical protein
MENTLNAFINANPGLLESKALRVSGGGAIDTQGSLPIAELSNASGMCLGTVVLVDCLWAVTTAHCVRKAQTRLFVRQNRDDALRIEVDSIYWESGETVSMDNGDPWPADVEEMEDVFDQTAVLKLKKPLFLVNGNARLPSTAYPRVRDGLMMGGFGQNEDGNYEKYPRVWSMHFFGPEPGWRGAAYYDPSDPIGGFPREGDSGAPVFYVRFIGGFWPRFTVALLGTHRGRIAAGPNTLKIPEKSEVAEFIPLAAGTQSWIRKLIAPSVAASKKAAMSTFGFRGLFNCLTLEPTGEGLDSSEWVLNAVAGEGKFLEPCDNVTIEIATRTMKIYRCGDKTTSVVEVTNLRPVSLTGEAAVHCLVGSDSGSKPNTYYIFLRSAGQAPPDSGQTTGNPCRRIIIEVYVYGSAHTPPNGKNVGTPVAEVIENEIACTCQSRAHFLALSGGDQDDQGNGYERH